MCTTMTDISDCDSGTNSGKVVFTMDCNFNDNIDAVQCNLNEDQCTCTLHYPKKVPSNITILML